MKVRVTEGVLREDAKGVPSGEECVEKETAMSPPETPHSLEKEEERVLRAVEERSLVDSTVRYEDSVSRRHSSSPFISRKHISPPPSTHSVALLSSIHR